MNNGYDRSLSTYEVSRKLGISTQAVRELCKYGKIPGAYQTHKNGYWRIPVNSLDLIDLKYPPTWYDKAKYIIWTNKLRSFIILVVGILTFFFAAISAGADIGGAREQLIKWGIVRTFSKATDNEILIVICRFNYSDNLVDTRIEEEIKRKIEATLSNFNINDFRVEIDDRRIRAEKSDEAYKLFSQHNATIVIWGEDTGVRVTVNMATSPSDSKSIIEETDFTQLANPNEYQSFIISKLPAHVSFVSLFASGLVLERDSHYMQAIEIIEKAVKDLEPEAPVEGVTNAYYALGNLYQQDETDIEGNKKAIEYYNLVIDLSPNEYTETGKVYENRGFAKVVVKDLNGALSDFKSFVEALNHDKDDITASAYSYRGMARIVVADDYYGGIEDVLYSQELINDPKIKCLNTTLLAEGYLKLLLNSLPDSTNWVFDPTEHLALADKIIELNPGECNEGGAAILAHKKSFAYLIRGTINSQLGNHELALSDFQNLLIINPDFEEREAIEKNIEFEKNAIESSK